MGELLAGLYPWIKSIHIMSVIAWMAGLFYLPRLFVHHSEKLNKTPQIDPVFVEMEHKLLKVIMNPAMISTWLFGVLLVLTPGIVDWSALWPYCKAISVILMTLFHHWLAKRYKDFAAGKNTLSGRRYRIMNEVPTVLMIVIVLSVVVKF